MADKLQARKAQSQMQALDHESTILVFHYQTNLGRM